MSKKKIIDETLENQTSEDFSIENQENFEDVINNENILFQIFNSVSIQQLNMLEENINLEGYEQELELQKCILSFDIKEECYDLLEQTLLRNSVLFLDDLVSNETKDELWEKLYEPILVKINKYDNFDFQNLLRMSDNLEDTIKISEVQNRLELEPVETTYTHMKTMIEKSGSNYDSHPSFENLSQKINQITEDHERCEKTIYFRSYYENLIDDFPKQLETLREKYFLKTRENRGLYVSSEICESYSENENKQRFYILRNFDNELWNMLQFNTIKKVTTLNLLMNFFYDKMNLVLENIQNEYSENFSYLNVTFEDYETDKNYIAYKKIFEKISQEILPRDIICRKNPVSLYDTNDEEVLLWNDIIIVSLLNLKPEQYVDYILLFKIIMYTLNLFSMELIRKIILNALINFINIINTELLFESIPFKDIMFVTLFNFILKIELINIEIDKRTLNTFYSIENYPKIEKGRLKEIIKEFYYGDSSQNFDGYKNTSLSKYFIIIFPWLEEE